jgi:diguanylate cyclase (GGDEF)-like protein
VCRAHPATTPPRDVILDPTRQDPARQQLPPAAATILWQSKIRIAVALVAGAAAMLLSWTDAVPGSATSVLACVGGYLALVGTLYLVARHARETPSPAIAVMLLGDLLLVFATTVLNSRPDYYDRSLIFSFFVLHLTEFYFGRAYAYLVTGAVASGYLALVEASIRHGAALDWGEELWSVGVFVIAVVLFTQQYGGLRRRVGKLVTLFERAEEGDFSQEYDVGADHRPDAITAVGHAYNRVRAQLQSMILTDPLTGCLNRRGFDQALGREIARSTRSGSELGLLAIDLDHFKLVNDTCGHLAGDAVLRDMGALLQQTVRAGDIVARTGGEEFTILLPDAATTGAFQLAARLCERIRGRPFIVGGKQIRVTVSVGVAAGRGSAVDRQGQELKLRADQALYAAKRMGRDRVLAWSPALSDRRSMEMLNPLVTG